MAEAEKLSPEQNLSPPVPQDASQASPQSVDEGWNNFVQNTVQQPSNQNDAGWSDFVSKNADKATAPSTLSQIEGAVQETAHVANSVVQGIGGAINSQVEDMYKSFTTVPKLEPNAAYEGQLSDDLKKFRDSKSYTEGAANFASMVSDIVAPSAKQFIGEAYADQFKNTVAQVKDLLTTDIPKDEYGNPISESIGQSIERTMNIIGAPFQIASTVLGFNAAAQAIIEPVAQKLYPNDPELQKQFSQGFGQMAGQLPFFHPGIGDIPKPPLITRAEDAGVFKGEDAYFNEPLLNAEKPVNRPEEPTVEQTTPLEAPQEKVETPVVPKTINDVVRQNEPELFAQYDDISARQDRLRGWISDLSGKREETHEVVETQSKIDAILSKVNGVEDRLTNKKSATLEDLRSQLDDIKSRDTPDMALIRDQLQKLDEQKRDMAEKVSAAYRTAREQMPEEAKPDAVEPEKTPNFNVLNDALIQSGNMHVTDEGSIPANNFSDAEREELERLGLIEDFETDDGTAYKGVDVNKINDLKEKGKTEGKLEYASGENNEGLAKLHRSIADKKRSGGDEVGAAASEQKAAEFEKKSSPEFSIIDDVSKKLVAVGRPQEEANAAAQLVESHYRAISEQGWANGTPEEIYQRDMANIRAGRESRVAQMAQSGKRGSIDIIGREARNTITLMKSANASTFMHEMGHHWLEEMMSYAAKENAPQSLLDSVKSVRDWLGLKEGKEIPRAAHEKFARGFERYLMEGVAPSKDLAGVFAKFKKWLTDIYQTVAKLRSPINDDIRAVYDKLLSSSPEKTVIAPDHEAGKMMADIHEADAAHTPPEEASGVADNVRVEIDRTAKDNDKEAYNDIKSAEAGRGPSEASGNPAIEPNEPIAPEAEPSAVGASGSAVEAEGVGTRPDAATTGAGSPSDTAGSGDGGTRQPAANGSRVAPDTNGIPETTATSPKRGQESDYVDKSGRFRLDKFNTSHDAMDALKEMVARNSDFLDARYGTDAYKQAQLIRANKQLLAQLSEEFVAARKTANGSPEDMLKYLRISEQMQIAGKIRAELQADWAHAGHALNEVTRTENVPDIAALVKEVTSKTMFQLEEEAKLMEQQPSPEAMADFANDMRSGKWRRFEDGTLSYFRNNILSNPITHVVYLIGNYYWAMQRATLNKAIGGLIRGEDVSTIKHEIGTALSAIHNAAFNAFPVAAAAVKSGVPFMKGAVAPLVREAMEAAFGGLSEKQDRMMGDEEHELYLNAREEVRKTGITHNDIKETLAYADANKDEAAVQASKYPAIQAYLEYAASNGTKDYKQSVPGSIGGFLTVPERAIQGVHTISYAMNYEMEVAGRAFQDGIDKGFSGDDLSTHIAKYTQNPPIETMQAAHEDALTAVFMNRPKYGSMQQKIGSLAHNDIPVIRLITETAMPFVQIGTNILDQGLVESTPLGFLKQSVRDDLSGKNGNVARSNAAAKMIAGSSMGMAAMGLSATGFITGGGPSDYNKRQVLEAIGWKPYSIRIGDVYIPYKKWMGPMGPLMGASADLGEGIHDLSEGDAKHAALAISAAFSENVADETWLNGMSNLMQAYRSEGSLWKYIENIATGFVPYSSALNQARQWTDSVQRQVTNQGPENLWGLAPKIANRVPFLSSGLEPKVDVFGQPMVSGTAISPSYNRNDPIVQKLADLDIGIASTKQDIMGVKLTPEQYNHYSVAAGVLIKENLSWIISDPGFGQLSHGEQIKEISNAVKSSRKSAAQQVMYENPEIIEKASAKKEKAEE